MPGFGSALKLRFRPNGSYRTKALSDPVLRYRSRWIVLNLKCEGEGACTQQLKF